MRKRKKLINTIKYGYVLLTAIAILGGHFYVSARTIVSPLPDQPSIKVVFPTATPTPIPTPTPKPTPINGTPTRQEIEREIETVFSPSGADAIRQAKIVVGCESNYNPLAINEVSFDYGLFQINHIHSWDTKILLDWKQNIRIAYVMYLKQGWQPWYSSKFCWSSKF